MAKTMVTIREYTLHESMRSIKPLIQEGWALVGIKEIYLAEPETWYQLRLIKKYKRKFLWGLIEL